MDKLRSLIVLIVVYFLINTLVTATTNSYISYKDGPAPGYLFLAPMDESATISCYDHALMTPYKSTFTNNSIVQLYDLKLLSNGHFIAYAIPLNYWLVFDYNFNLIDSIKLSTNYENDFHEIICLPNGNYILMGSKDENRNMQQIVPGGRTDAVIKDFVIFEITPSGEIVFQWSAIEHLAITDATEDVDLTAHFINPFHINSIFQDTDNNLLLSVRHQDAIVKISHTTGEVMWRMGGTKSRNTEFTISNDTRNGFTGFSHQHDVQRLSNGNILIFDNGNLKPESESRAVEYEINETNKTARKVWEYHHSPAIFSSAMGSVQRLANGNTLIGWGGNDGGRHTNIATEVTNSGDVTLEINGETGIYRAYKFLYKMDYVEKDVNQPMNVNFNDNAYTTNISLNLQYLAGNGKITVEKHKYQPHNISFSNDNSCAILPFRWVINTRNIDSLNGLLKINLTELTDNEPIKLKICYRREENTGDFEALPTSYNQSANQLYASINHPGEVMIIFDDYLAPRANLPVSNAVNVIINPTLKWNKIKTNEQYALQLALDSLFRQIVIDTNKLTLNELRISELNVFTRYYWRIKAFDTNCESQWSPVYTFQTSYTSPQLLSPSDNSKEQKTSQKFKWSRVDGTNQYKLQISEDESFSSLLLNIILFDNAEYAYAGLDNNKKYYWRVSAGNNNDFGLWSDPYVFNTIMSQVSLRLPLNKSEGIRDGDMLAWDQVSGATFYNILIAKDSLFHDIILDSAGIHSTSLFFKNIEFLTRYYWKVKAVNDESMSEWSQMWSFRTTMPKPELQSPLNGQTGRKLNGYLIWNTVPEADYYEIRFSADSSFNNDKEIKSTYKASFSYQDLSYGTGYYWMIKAKNKNGESDWSQKYNFRTVNPDDLISPDLLSPINLSNKNDLTTSLKWSKIENASYYEIEADVNNNFANPGVRVTNILDTTIQLRILKNNSDYYWRVRSVNDKKQSEWSDFWKFTTKLETTKLLYPSFNQTDVNNNSVFIWNKIDGALFYNLEIALDIGFSDILYQKGNIQDTTITNFVFEPGKTYYWHVMSSNINNQSDWSTSGKFSAQQLTDVENTNAGYCIYPNPVTEKLYVSMINGLDEIRNIKLIDLWGQIIIEQYKTTNTANFDIDVSKLTSGNYLLIINNGNRTEYFKVTKY